MPTSGADTKLIGHLLLDKGIITPEQLKVALSEQKTVGGLLGKIMMGHGYISSVALAKAIAEQNRMSFIDTLKEPPDYELFIGEMRDEYLNLEFIPWRKDSENKVIILATEPNAKLVAIAEEIYGVGNIKIAVTSRFDIIWSVSNIFINEDINESKLHLWRQNPSSSVREMRFSNQLSLLAALCVFILAFSFVSEGNFLLYSIIAINFLYFCSLLFKTAIFSTGIFARQRTRKAKAKIWNDDLTLPVYTILVPLFREKEVVAALINNLKNIDYPKSKLDIKLVVEEDDYETIQAIKDVRPESYFEIIRVPYSYPRTKPKACNYAIRFARGEYVTIYDAEDNPPKTQLREAIYLFKKNKRHICLQGKLNYYNRNSNILTKMFSIEYATWFEFLLEGLQKCRLPIPLGGTSNHIPMQLLRESGEWDPYNVTEDADLGIRFAVKGVPTRLLSSTTMEEAPCTLKAWVNQRSRWIKGYIQTYFVNMRHPFRLLRSLGINGFIGFQLFIGGPTLIFITTPILLVITLLWGGGILTFDTANYPEWLFLFCIINLVFGFTAHLLMAAIVVGIMNWRKMMLAVIAYPFYWYLHSIASFKALIQFFTRPHFWEKTTHGVVKVKSEVKKG